MRALSKLERVFPARLQRRAQALRDRLLLLERAGPVVSAARLTQLTEACDGKRVLSFDYTSRSAVFSRRTVEPAAVVHTGRWYLVAFDRDRGDCVTFRVDRIGKELRTGAGFHPRLPPEGGDLRAFVSRSLSSGAYRYQVVVVLHAPAEEVTARLFPSTALVEPLGAGRTRSPWAPTPCSGWRPGWRASRWDFEAVEPPELVRALREVRQRIDTALAASRPEA